VRRKRGVEKEKRRERKKERGRGVGWRKERRKI
jgi:hypothetical protein